MEGVIVAIEASVNGGVGAQDASAAYSACEKVFELTVVILLSMFACSY